MGARSSDEQLMERAIVLAASARTRTSPNPWVGCVVEAADGTTFEGATEPPGGPHAEVVALRAAGDRSPGRHPRLHARAVFASRAHPAVRRCDRRSRVSRASSSASRTPTRTCDGRGIAQLRGAASRSHRGLRRPGHDRSSRPTSSTGAPVVPTSCSSSRRRSTAARRRPTARASGSRASRRARDAHRLRAESDAVIVGAGTVRADDPSLTVRHVEGRDPLRVVLGRAPEQREGASRARAAGRSRRCARRARRQGVVQAMVEGGATVAAAFHRAGLVDRYVLYLAPALFGGDDARALFSGPGAPDASTTCGGDGSSPSTASATTCDSSSNPDSSNPERWSQPDVHRHRRRARPRHQS